MTQSIIHRGKRGAQYLAGGTQYVDGALTLPSSSWTIYLSNAIYGATGNYVLFDYKNGSFNGLNLDKIVFDDSNLTLSGVNSVVDVPAEYKVILKLQSKATNGTQYVENTLDVSAGMIDVYMSSALYKTAGTYVLFSFPNGITGKFIGPVTNINVNPPAGRTVSGTAFVDTPNNCIKVTLL